MIRNWLGYYSDRMTERVRILIKKALDGKMRKV